MFNVEVAKPSNKYMFKLILLKGNKLIGNIWLYKHPLDQNGGEIHIKILPKWRKKWLWKQFREVILATTIREAKNSNIKMLYSTALTLVSPRLLEFFGFKEYNRKQPKTHYYLEVI